MEEAYKILINSGVVGAVAAIAIWGYVKQYTLLIKSYEARLKEKDEIIQKLMDNDLRQAHIVELFREVKPLFEEIRELLRKWYTNKAGL
jgi:hypothetical protein